MKKIKEIDCDSSDIIQEIKQDYCICRKNKVQGLYEQCTNKKKYGDFCGKHAKSKEKLLVSESLPANLKKYITFSSYQNLGDKVLNNSTNLELINTLRNYKLKTNDYSKNNMVNLILNHFQLLLQYSSDDKIKKIKKIQNLIKNYIQNKELRLRGPAYQNRILCNNTDDFLTFEEIELTARDGDVIKLNAFKDTCKIICTGEGGVGTTNSYMLYELMQKYRSHGVEKNPSKRIG